MAETVIMPNSGDMLGLGGGNGLGAILIGALLGGGNGLFGNRGGWGGYGMGSPAAGAVASEVVLTPTLNAIQNQISNLSNEVDSNQILAGLTSINQNVSGTSRDIGRDIANLSTAQAAGNFTTLNSINGLGRDIVASQTQALINNLQNFNNLQGSLTTSTNQIISNQAANAAAVAAGFCTLSREAAECCCETKQLIRDDGAATRALINDLNVQSLQAQLTDAKVQISNNSQNQYLLTQILTHIHPTPVVVS
jgi:hypothetical protein